MSKACDMMGVTKYIAGITLYYTNYSRIKQY